MFCFFLTEKNSNLSSTKMCLKYYYFYIQLTTASQVARNFRYPSFQNNYWDEKLKKNSGLKAI